MTRWKREIRIKQLFEECEDDCEGTTRKIAAILMVQPEYGRDQDFTDIADRMDGMDDLDEANYIVAELYDWADANRIWIGGDFPSKLPSVA